MNGEDFLNLDADDLVKTGNTKMALKFVIVGQQNLFKKFNEVEKKLLNPDEGIYARIKSNTDARKLFQRIFIGWGAIMMGLITVMLLKIFSKGI